MATTLDDIRALEKQLEDARVRRRQELCIEHRQITARLDEIRAEMRSAGLPSANTTRHHRRERYAGTSSALRDFLRANPGATRRDVIAGITGVSKNYLVNRLSQFVTTGVVKASGDRGSYVYYLNETAGDKAAR